jgi:kynurenine formamidase
MGEHTGTHVDAPSHWIPPPESGLRDAGPAGSISIDDVPLEQLMGPAVLIDVSQERPGEPGRSPRIEAAELSAFEEKNGRIRQGEIVLVRTGWDVHYLAGEPGRRYIVDCVNGRQPAWPALTAEAVGLLVDRGVRCLGIDTPSVGAIEDGRPAHLAGLAHGLVYVESLAGLSALPVRGAIFVILPMPLRGGSGAPGRAIALIKAS